MGFATALSGLNAASTSLQVIGNNIANANTTGFKESRAEFADVYNSTGPTTPGAGVRVTEVAQQFHQGNIEATQNNLDLSLAGNGFFALGESSDATGPTAYTRNGAFHLSPEGYIVNDNGRFLLGGAPIGTTISEGFNTGAPQPIQIDTSQGAPAATKTVDLKANLDSRDGRPAVAFAGYDPAVQCPDSPMGQLCALKCELHQTRGRAVFWTGEEQRALPGKLPFGDSYGWRSSFPLRRTDHW